MASVTIDSGPVSATNRLRDVPREKWHDLMLARRQFMEIRLSHDCRCLIEFVNDASQMYSALGFDSVEAMIRNGYHLEPAEIAVAVEWLRLNPPDQPVSLTRAVTLGQQGGDRRSERAKADQGCITTLKRGTADYTLARLDRDGRSDLATEVRSGEISANAAAIKAGFRHQPTPYERVLKLLPKLSPDECRALLDELTKVSA